MSVLFTIDEKIRLLAQQYGVSPARAAGLLAEQEAPTIAVWRPGTPTEPQAMLVFPIRLTLPWSALCSDNFHERASLIRLKSGDVKPRKVMDARYKAALGKTREIARIAMEGFDALARPLALHARVYLPGGSARNDAINFSKCAHDAMQGVIFDNDRWLYRVLWERAGVDVDRPRADILISPLSE